MNGTITLTYKWARRIAISLIGGTVLIAGVAMTVLPGPAVVVIPLGLGILGLEFAWARRWLRRVKERAQQFMPGLVSSPAARPVAGDGSGSAEAHRLGAATSTARPTPHGHPDKTVDRVR